MIPFHHDDDDDCGWVSKMRILIVLPMPQNVLNDEACTVRPEILLGSSRLCSTSTNRIDGLVDE